MTYLEYAGTVGCSPCIKQVILARTNEPLSAVSELERENTTLMKVQLVFVWLGVMQHLHVAAFHSERVITF